MESIENIKKHNATAREHLFSNFSNNLEKAISPSEFDAKYGQGHTIHKSADIEGYLTAADKELGELSKAEQVEALTGVQETISALTKVIVKGEGIGNYDTYYVAPIVESEDSNIEEETTVED